jgi:hypothetical protein
MKYSVLFVKQRKGKKALRLPASAPKENSEGCLLATHIFWWLRLNW